MNPVEGCLAHTEDQRAALLEAHICGALDEVARKAIGDASERANTAVMQEDALEKVARGVTTLEEVLRVVPFDSIVDSTCRRCHKRLPPTFPFCPNCGERAQLSSTVIQPIRGQLQSIRSGGH